MTYAAYPDAGPPGDNYVAATYAQLLYDYLDARGVDALALLGRMPVEEIAPGLERVPLLFWERALARADALLNEPALGLAVGRTITPRHFGLLGYVVLSGANLGEGLARMERYHRLIYDVNPARVETHGDWVEIRWGVERGLSGQLVDETGVAAVVQIVRDVLGEAKPVQRVGFVNPRPADLAPYQAYFAGEVLFGQAETFLRVPMSYLTLPLRAPDPNLLAILDGQAEALLARHGEGEDRFAAQLARLMRERRPTLEALAALNHVSVRTLQRRLQQRGERFQDLLERTRYRLARAYLSDSRLELVEVAALLGYSEHSAFSRAFKLWSGLSPAQWRRTGAAP
ncbi:AraC family transcriptional regulator [Alcanivorax sp. N3-2A]|nr:AraC family transcriptional regulator [Alcanivorax sp. N3-2A]|tara:strand:- start:22696 stop:23721 length:1026 start_codon:yes stop_codon:yes gene_type:complete